MQKVRYEHPALKYTEENEGSGFIDIEGRMEVCPECGGFGTHERRDIDTSRLVDSMIEDGDDDGLDAYYNGAFDVICTKCRGKNVVLEPNWDLMPEWAKDAVIDWEEAERQHQAEVAAERRVGA